MTRVDHEWGVELSFEPISGIPLIARIVRIPTKANADIQFTWDGTPTDGHVTMADAAAFVNSLKVLIEEARGVAAEVEKGGKRPRKSRK